MRTFIIKPGDLIPIGRAGENQATQIRFDVTGWADTFGAGTYTLVVKRPHEDTAYPVEVTTDGDYVVWTVSNVDTGIAGNASVQLRYVVDGALAKSVIYNGIVGESLDNIVDPPDPFEDLIQRMVDLAERTEAAAESAAGSAASSSESAGTATAAKESAQAAAQAAQTAQGTATQAAQTATQAKDAAQTAQQAAEAAQSAAAQSATAASGSATAAAGSAAQAAASATAADASAAAAAQSAAAAQAAAQNVIDKAPIITDTASGAIASFPDGTDAPIKQLTVNIEPQQDLHGYDNPWPAGGGRNKLDIANASIAKPSWYSGTWLGTSKNSKAGITQERGYKNGGAGGFTVILKQGATYTISWTYDKVLATACMLYVGSYNGTELRAVKNNVTVTSDTNRFSSTFTVPSDSLEIAIRPTAYATTQSGQTYDIDYIQIELGSTATAFAPYSNECPITGWTGATVTRTGKNLWGGQPFADAVLASCTSAATQSGNIVTLPNGASNVQAYTDDRAKMFENQFQDGSYTIIIGQSDTDVALATRSLITAFYTDGTSTAIVAQHYDATKKLWRWVSDPAKRLAFLRMNRDDGNREEYDISRCGIFQGDVSVTDFVPYAGTTYPITWQTEAGTVYGGHLTVEQDGSGTLMAEFGTHTIDENAGLIAGSSSYDKTNTTDRYVNISGMKSVGYGTNQHIKADKLKYVYGKGIWFDDTTSYYNTCTANSGQFHMNFENAVVGISSSDTGATRTDKIKAWLANNPIQVCYELATPITYTLTAAEMATLFGQNNWWSNTGNIENLEYRCDTRRYIDKKLAALLAALS